jgi:hypothetical protein
VAVAMSMAMAMAMSMSMAIPPSVPASDRIRRRREED